MASLHYYYPRFPRPRVLLSVRAVPSFEMAVVLQTLAGLVARQALQARSREMIWVPPPQTAYRHWLKMLLAHTGARLDGNHSIWELVERYRARGVVKGYVLYRFERSSRPVNEITPEMDISLNVATSLCSVLNAVAVDESLQQEAEARGLRLLADASMSSEYIGKTFPAAKLRSRHPPSLWELDWREDVHYVAFIMSDGDNVSWLMGNFIEDAERAWWSNPHRGKFPIGWSFCYTDLAQVCPYALQHLYETATPKDDLVLMGGGYYYPDRFGVKRSEPLKLLRLHAERVGAYMRMGRLRTLLFNTQRWDSPEAVRAYRLFAQTAPNLLGIFAIQYYPYPAGKGKVIWVDNEQGDQIPVVSARYAIWSNVRRENEGTPSMVARWLNSQPVRGQGNVEERFSWVTVHCWSWFRKRTESEPPEAEDIDQAKDTQPGVERGLSPVKWCVEQLAPHVQVVTPSNLLLLLRLHKNPANTLRKELQQLRDRCRVMRKHHPRLVANLERQLQSAWRSMQQKDYRAAFERGKAVYRQLRGV